MLTTITTSQFKETNTFPSIAAHAGLSLLPLLSATESRSPEKLNGLMLWSLLRFWSHAKTLMMAAEEEMLRMLMNGFITTTLLMRLALPIKPMATITELDVVQWLNAKTVCQIVDVGHKLVLKSTELVSSDKWKENKQWWMRSINVDLLLALLLLLYNSKTTLQVSLLTKPEELNSTMILVWQVGEKKTELSIGLFVTHGDLTGVKEETSDWSEEPTTLTLKENALGQFPLILGLMMLEMKLN